MEAVNNLNTTTTASNVVVVKNSKEKAFFLKLRERKMENLKKLESIGLLLNNGTK